MLNSSASLAMSKSVLKALPGKLDIKRREPGIILMSNENAPPTKMTISFQRHNILFLQLRLIVP